MRISRAGTSNRSRGRAGRRLRAFTLVELIVVIVVLGLCAATVFPRVPGLLLREPEPWRSARRLLRTAQYAQKLAVAAESPFVLQIDVDTGKYRAAGKASGNDSARATPSDLQGQLSEEVRITWVDSPGNDPIDGVLSITCGPEGWCDPAALRITASDGQTVTVVIPEWAGEMGLLDEEQVE